MQTWIYKGSRKAHTYLYVIKEQDFSAVPNALLRLLGELQPVMQVELSSKRQLAQVDVTAVIEQLQTQGYFLQLPPGTPSTEKPC